MKIRQLFRIDALLWSVIIVLPTAISFFDIYNLFSPFKFPILLFFTGIILVLIVLQRKIKWDKIIFIAFFWILFVLMASFNAYNQELAFLGYFSGSGRCEGFLSLFCYIFLWFAAKNYLIINAKRILIFFVGLIPFSLYALIQYYGKDPLVINYGFAPRIFSTIGNQNFVGSLAVMLVVLSSSLFVLRRKWVYFYFALLFFSTLVICQTRSAWVAGAIVITGFLFYQFILKKKVLFPLYLILGYVLVFLILLNSQKQNTITQKYKTIAKEMDLSNEYGGSGRLKIWSITNEVLLQNPLLGVGPENLKLAIETEQPQLHNEYYRRTKTTIDRAHNEYLHMAVTCGIPTLCTYLLVIFMSFKSSMRSILTSTWSMAVSLAVTAYLIQAFFNISVIAVAPIFWIFLGGLAGNRFISQDLMDENNQKNQIKIIE
ncbi:MAG: O-antigen ligase family protein [Bacteroidetes bacterium]|nr:O-antigen ligase family protein [Bacteroidota bacterium]